MKYSLIHQLTIRIHALSCVCDLVLLKRYDMTNTILKSSGTSLFTKGFFYFLFVKAPYTIGPLAYLSSPPRPTLCRTHRGQALLPLFLSSQRSSRLQQLGCYGLIPPASGEAVLPPGVFSDHPSSRVGTQTCSASQHQGLPPAQPCRSELETPVSLFAATRL